MKTPPRRRVYANRAITHAISAALCLLAAAVTRAFGQRVVAADAMPCKACHEQIVTTFVQTAHFQTSAEATAQSIKGRFVVGHNLLRTRADGIYFKMEQRKGAFYQTGVDSAHSRARTERIDLVIGSGRRVQSYLYWKNGLLFELPVSYLAGIDQWINSPGYTDGEIDFARVIVPRCRSVTAPHSSSNRSVARCSTLAIMSWAFRAKSATATGTSMCSTSRPIRRSPVENTLSIRRTSPERESWITAPCVIRACGSRSGPRSRTGRVKSWMTTCPSHRMPRSPTCTEIRSDSCGAASAFAPAQRCPAPRATTSIDRNESWLRSRASRSQAR